MAGIGDLPIYDQDLEGSRPPGRRAPAPGGLGRGRRDPLRDARVQRLGPRRPEERDRLGVAPAARGALTNKNVAVIGASTGQFGAMWAQADLRRILGIAGARVVGDELPVTRRTRSSPHAGPPAGRRALRAAPPRAETLAAESIPVPSRRSSRKKGAASRPRIRYQLVLGRGASCSGWYSAGRRETRRPLRWLGDSP